MIPTGLVRQSSLWRSDLSFPQLTHVVKCLSRETEDPGTAAAARYLSHWRNAKGPGAYRKDRHGRFSTETWDAGTRFNQEQQRPVGDSTSKEPWPRGLVAPFSLPSGPKRRLSVHALGNLHSLLCGISFNPHEIATRKLGKMTLTLQRGRLRFGEVNLLTVV